jgi:cupin 2 domain-containing protein
MRPGDFVQIPALRKHRVDWTSPDEITLWLAIFFAESPN